VTDSVHDHYLWIDRLLNGCARETTGGLWSCCSLRLPQFSCFGPSSGTCCVSTGNRFRMVSYTNHAIFWDRLHPIGEVRMSRRQVRYAIHGIEIGLTASVVLISGTIMIVRLSLGRQIGHRVPFGFALFTTLFVLIVYRLRHRYFYLEHKAPRSTRSATHGAVTELSKGDQNQSKSA
jgi:hypothetical protein